MGRSPAMRTLEYAARRLRAGIKAGNDFSVTVDERRREDGVRDV